MLNGNPCSQEEKLPCAYPSLDYSRMGSGTSSHVGGLFGRCWLGKTIGEILIVSLCHSLQVKDFLKKKPSCCGRFKAFG